MKKCIIYTNDLQIGKNKLYEIKGEKADSGIGIKEEYISSRFEDNRIYFEDDELWTIVSPSDRARGYKWSRAYVDATNTTIAALELVIKPAGHLHGTKDIKYFNW